MEELKTTGKLLPIDTGVLGELDRLIEECKQAPLALGDWAKLMEQPAELLPGLLELRGTLFFQDGRTADAAAAATKLRELGTATAGQLYNAACVYSLSADTIKPAEGQELTAEHHRQRDEYIQDALDTLREAIAAGWNDFDHMRQDPDLAALRALPEFEALLSESKSQKDASK